MCRFKRTVERETSKAQGVLTVLMSDKDAYAAAYAEVFPPTPSGGGNTAQLQQILEVTVRSLSGAHKSKSRRL